MCPLRGSPRGHLRNAICAFAGLVVFGTLNLSSPVLHLSKLASCLGLQTARVALFALFAVVFFFTRVLMFPYFILKWCVQFAAQQKQSMASHCGCGGTYCACSSCELG